MKCFNVKPLCLKIAPLPSPDRREAIPKLSVLSKKWQIVTIQRLITWAFQTRVSTQLTGKFSSLAISYICTWKPVLTVRPAPFPLWSVLHPTWLSAAVHVQSQLVPLVFHPLFLHFPVILHLIALCLLYCLLFLLPSLFVFHSSHQNQNLLVDSHCFHFHSHLEVCQGTWIEPFC